MAGRRHARFIRRRKVVKGEREGEGGTCDDEPTASDAKLK